MKCENCDEPLPALYRRNKRYCDARCRRRAFEQRQRTAASEPAPVVPISDDAQAQELLARVIAEPRLVALVTAAAKTNWRAAAFLLGRQYPERWAPLRRPQTEAEPPGVDDWARPARRVVVDEQAVVGEVGHRRLGVRPALRLDGADEVQMMTSP